MNYYIKKTKEGYTCQELNESVFKTDDEYWDFIDALNLKEEAIAHANKPEDIICIEYNKDWLTYLFTWEDIQNEFEDNVVNELKNNSIFEDIVFVDDPDDDDVVTTYQVFTPKFINQPYIPKL